MKKGIFLALVLHFPFVHSAELKGINFNQKNEISRLEFSFDTNDVKFKKFNLIKPKQIIVDFENVSAGDRVLRAFDTSEFSGGIVYVSAYKKNKNLRVLLQLRDNVRAIMKRAKNKLILNVENHFGVFNEKNMNNESIVVKRNEKINIPASDSIDDILYNITLSGRKKYLGKKISINVKQVKMEDVFQILAEVSGFNVILDESVKSLPPLTLNLNNIPWDQALDTILSLKKLIAKKNGSILIVTTLDKYNSNIKSQEEISKLKQVYEPLVTKIFSISYSEIKTMESMIKEYISKRGTVLSDERTNSLIVRDKQEVIEKIRKIIEVLDTQTPQILIESKIIEVDENYSKNIGFAQGFNIGYDPIGETGANPDEGPGFSFNTASLGGEGRRLFEVCWD